MSAANAMRKSEPVLNLEGFFGAKGVALRMKGQKTKTKATTAPAKVMSLKAVRDMLGLTIEGMAKKIGTKRSTYFFWEKGTRPMPDNFQTRVKALVIEHSQKEPATNGHTEAPKEGGFPTGK